MLGYLFQIKTYLFSLQIPFRRNPAKSHPKEIDFRRKQYLFLLDRPFQRRGNTLWGNGFRKQTSEHTEAVRRNWRNWRNWTLKFRMKNFWTVKKNCHYIYNCTTTIFSISFISESSMAEKEAERERGPNFDGGVER